MGWSASAWTFLSLLKCTGYCLCFGRQGKGKLQGLKLSLLPTVLSLPLFAPPLPLSHAHTKYKGLKRPVSGFWTHHYQLKPGDLLNLTALLIDCNCMVEIDWLCHTQYNMHLLEVTGKGKGSNDFPSCPLANDPVQTLTDTLPYWGGKGYFCISLWIFCLPRKRRFWFPF